MHLTLLLTYKDFVSIATGLLPCSICWKLLCFAHFKDEKLNC